MCSGLIQTIIIYIIQYVDLGNICENSTFCLIDPQNPPAHPPTFRPLHQRRGWWIHQEDQHIISLRYSKHASSWCSNAIGWIQIDDRHMQYIGCCWCCRHDCGKCWMVLLLRFTSYSTLRIYCLCTWDIMYTEL